MRKIKNSKKGVSPIIATVLLVAIVVIIGLIIFLWFRSLTEEAVTKFGGQNIQLVCEDVEFLVSYSSSGIFSISNTGNVPINNINLEISEGRDHRTKSLSELSDDWSTLGLRQGESFSGDLSEEFSEADEVFAIPVLMGTSESGEKPHVCEERHGKEVSI
ncbi:MAG: archaellin/type IV pilin N-terminal domain-containing protein [Candidatus Pacearchaeota archaeon]